MKPLLRYLFLLMIAVAGTFQAMAQTRLIDSLQNELKTPTNDSVTVFIYTGLGNEYYAYDTVKSMFYLEKGHLLAKKMGWDYALGNYYSVKGMLRQLSSEHEKAHLFFDSAIHFFNRSIKSARTAKEAENARLEIAVCLGQKADILIKKGKHEEAITTFLSVLEAWRASDAPRKNEAMGTYYAKISTLYYELKQFEKALRYDKLALSMYLSEKNEEAIAWAYVYVCDDFIALKQMDSCLLYLNKAKPIADRLNNHRLNVQYYNKLGQISLDKKDYRRAIVYFEKCVLEATITNTKSQILSNQRMIAVSYVRLGEFAAARKYLLLALPGAVGPNFVKSKIEILQDLVTVEEGSDRPAVAYGYLKQVVTLRDSLNQESSKKAVAEIESKYRTTENEKTILGLEKDKQIQSLSIQQHSSLNYFLGGSLAGLLLLAFLVYRNLRNRQELTKRQGQLQVQRIRELEKDKQLVAVDSMLKGQEEERSRLAKDLHDGLGGLLSGIKFSLINMKDNLIISADNMAVFERSLDMIDTSIKELRRVAHNMMPEMLTKFGLDEALKEYCISVNSTKLVALKYQSLGMTGRLEQATEIIVYRIVQELLNNILKHAAASEVFVQLIREGNRLSIVVEDNGKGFDTALLENSKGAGWTSIKSRVEYLKGQLDVHSEPGKGTLVNIEFNVA